MTFKIVVIGCGWVSMDCHGPAYVQYAETHLGVELTACCDLDAHKAATFSERFGFLRGYTHYQEMLQAEKPNAVCLNVPPEAICTIGCAILEQGFPLLCEKPPGTSVAEVDRLIATINRSDATHQPGAAYRPCATKQLGIAQQTGVIHQVAFNRRHMPLVVELKNQLRLKNQLAAQPVQAVEIVMARYRRLEADFTTTTVHAIDLARFLLDSDYGQVHFRYTTQEVSGQTVTNYLLEGEMVSGVTVRFSIYPATGMNVERVTVYCSDQAFELACSNGLDAPGWLRCYRENKLISEISGAQLAGSEESFMLNGFYAEDAAFFDAVQAREQPPDDLRSARQSVEIMQLLRERQDHFSCR